MDNTNDDLQAYLDALEDNRVEDTLRRTFGGDVERIRSEDGRTTWGWAVLRGRVMIYREALPVDCSGDVESECHRAKRQEILDIVRSAYLTGRMAAEAEAADDVDPELAAALANLADLKEQWDANEKRIARALRGRHA